MGTTLLLDRSAWDLALDSNGNIAVASEPYSQAQDVSSECRVFQGECYYDTPRGIPYFGQVLGRYRPIQVLKEKLAAAASLVPGVSSPTVFLTGNRREITGQVQFKTAQGTGVTAL